LVGSVKVYYLLEVFASFGRADEGVMDGTSFMCCGPSQTALTPCVQWSSSSKTLFGLGMMSRPTLAWRTKAVALVFPVEWLDR